MAVSITSDPILSVRDAEDVLAWNDERKTTLAINSVSARFLQHTNRLRITSGSVTEYKRICGVNAFWLRATPVSSVTSVEYYTLGDLSSTYTSDDYTVNLTNGKLVIHGAIPQNTGQEESLKVVYTGGWSTVPGDIVFSALQLMRLDKKRLDGALGVNSESREGFSTSFESGDLPRAVREVWDRYRILA